VSLNQIKEQTLQPLLLLLLHVLFHRPKILSNPLKAVLKKQEVKTSSVYREAASWEKQTRIEIGAAAAVEVAE
jgi:hypothetical protein